MAGLVREAAQRGARRRGHDVGRHRRGRDRQGPRHVRGRRDAGALPRRRARRGRQADDPRAHRRARSAARPRSSRRKLVAAGHPRARAHGRVREAVGEQRDVGPLGADAVRGAARRRRRRLLRAAHPRVHVPLGRAALHRPPRRGEGPARRAAQPEGAPAPPRHRPEDGRGVVPAVGPAALPRRVPVAPTARWRWCSAARRSPTPRRARSRGSTAWRCAASRRCSPAATR